MAYAVVLYFDTLSEKVLTDYMQQICEKGVNTYILDMGIRPHITLAIFNGIKAGDIRCKLNEFAKQNMKFKIRLESIGIFKSAPGVVYLSPVFTDTLSLIHREFYNVFNEMLEGYVPYYLPGSWVPHCTMAVRLQKEEVISTIDFLLDKFDPMDTEIVEIGLIECDSINEIYCCEIEKYVLG